MQTYSYFPVSLTWNVWTKNSDVILVITCRRGAIVFANIIVLKGFFISYTLQHQHNHLAPFRLILLTSLRSSCLPSIHPLLQHYPGMLQGHVCVKGEHIAETRYFLALDVAWRILEPMDRIEFPPGRSCVLNCVLGQQSCNCDFLPTVHFCSRNPRAYLIQEDLDSSLGRLSLL